MQGLPARLAAVKTLLAHHRSGAFLKELFPQNLRDLSPQDAALARAISLGVLRNLSWLDAHILPLAPRGIEDIRVMTLLRTAAWQMLLAQMPPHAVVSVSVEAAKDFGGAKVAGFVNALLKRLIAQGVRRLEGKDAASLSTLTSHPEWLVKRWIKALGLEGARKALLRSQEEPSVFVRLNPVKSSPENTLLFLADSGITLEPDNLAPGFYRTTARESQLLSHPLFAAGAFSLQDPAASFVVSLLDWRPPLSVLDLCAAPGGKSALLVEMAVSQGYEPGGVICADLTWKRLKRIQDARHRLGHHQLTPVVMDGLSPAFKNRFDRVLIDVPCSNLGVLARRPEARWRHRPDDIEAQGERQGALLASAASLLAPGGLMVYATCSPEPEETSRQVERFLARHTDFHLEPAEKRIPASLCRQGCLHLYPGETDYDGFFAAALRKKESQGKTP